MRILSLVCLLLFASLAWSQAEPDLPATAPQEAPSRADKEDKQPLPESASAVAPEAAIVTIKGLCPEPLPKAEGTAAEATCQTVITRAQFERLADAIHPKMPPTTKRQLAKSYPRMLVMAREAEQRGLDKQTHFEELIAYARVQILAQDLIRNIQDEAAQVPQKDIEDYYRNNSATFERARLERIIVPDIRQADVSKDNGGAPSEEKDKAAMKQEAEALRTRAVSGEDFVKLQQDAYKAAGLSTPPPSTSLVRTRRTSLQPEHQAVFDMKAGEISPVISDAGGYYIYKMAAKEIEPLNEAEVEIRKTLENQRMRAIMQKVQDSATTDLNPEYFGPPSGQRRPVAKIKANQAGAASTTIAPKQK